MANTRYEMSIVIPCYNEESMFLHEEYHTFIANHPQVALCFVNDGSVDGTLEVLKSYEKQYDNVYLYDLPQNLGKAEAVRQGILKFSKELDSRLVAFLDGDLAIPLEECFSFRHCFKKDIAFVFGSRLLRVGAEISRSKLRFIFSRVLATVISMMLNIKVYDTQCGVKCFRKEVVNELFMESFNSKWMFDVEIFFRALKSWGAKKEVLSRMYEKPLDRCVNRGDSKISMFYSIQVWFDLFLIMLKYK